MNLQLGPHSSILLQPNPLFVQYVKVENLDDSKSGTMLYGIYGSPTLDDVTTTAESPTATEVDLTSASVQKSMDKGYLINPDLQ